MNRPGRLVVRLTLLIGGLGLVGCAAKPVSITTPEEQHKIHYVVLGYMEAEGKLGHPPKNAEELKPYLKPFAPDGDVDKVLISSNDGLPFVVLYGTRTIQGAKGLPIVAFEQKGKDGKRLIANTQVRIWAGSDAEFARLESNAKAPPGY